jgi:hypothetical protein
MAKQQAAEKTAQQILAKIQGVAVVGMPASLEHTLGQIRTAIVPTGCGGISVVDGSAVQTIEGTAEKVTGFDTNGPSAGGVTPDAANDRIVVNQAGDYLVFCQLSFLGGIGAALYTAFIRINGVESSLSWQRRISAADATGSASCMGVLTLDAGDVLELYIEQDAGAEREITMVAAQLVVHQVG